MIDDVKAYLDTFTSVQTATGPDPLRIWLIVTDHNRGTVEARLRLQGHSLDTIRDMIDYTRALRPDCIITVEETSAVSLYPEIEKD